MVPTQTSIVCTMPTATLPSPVSDDTVGKRTDRFVPHPVPPLLTEYAEEKSNSLKKKGKMKDKNANMGRERNGNMNKEDKKK